MGIIKVEKGNNKELKHEINVLDYKRVYRDEGYMFYIGVTEECEGQGIIHITTEYKTLKETDIVYGVNIKDLGQNNKVTLQSLRFYGEEIEYYVNKGNYRVHGMGYMFDGWTVTDISTKELLENINSEFKELGINEPFKRDIGILRIKPYI